LLKLQQMPKAKTPSDFVGPNVRRFRELRGWRQRHLVERLEELGATTTGWSEVKVHRLETGKRQKVSLEDLFELAIALDVSPLQLIVPHGDEAAHTKVWIGGKVDRWSHQVKQWVRGVQPLLGRLDYKSDEAAATGHRFYLLDSQSLGEWDLIKRAGEYADQVRQSLELLGPRDEEEAPNGK
jgi:transcriptional regulator with XRE-family HTH domain